jgi:hypothetical protein
MINSQWRSSRKPMKEELNNLLTIVFDQVEIALDVGAPLGKRAVGRQRKNRMKGCLERGSCKKQSAKDTDKPKTRTLLRGLFKCPNCQELGHRKNSPKCPLNGTKKRQIIFFMCTNFDTITAIIVLITVSMCRKRKPRKNTTKGWFLKNVVDSSPPEDVAGSSSPPKDVVGRSSPPRVQEKKAVRKMTLKKKMAD